MSITVYAAILSGHDNLRPPRVIESGVRYVCFSDEPLCCPPWEIQPAFQPYESGGRNSRIPKILAHLHADTEYSIWHDGCLQMHIGASEAIDRWLRNADIALFQHPCRRFWQEIEFCQRVGIGPEDAARAMKAELPADAALWAGGVILRRHTPKVAAFNEDWWRLYREGSGRDQFTLAIALHGSGLRIETINANVLENEWWEFHFHAGAAFDHLKNQPGFVPERQKRSERMRALTELCT